MMLNRLTQSLVKQEDYLLSILTRDVYEKTLKTFWIIVHPLKRNLTLLPFRKHGLMVLVIIYFHSQAMNVTKLIDQVGEAEVLPSLLEPP